jgi:hypothetical protein
MEQESCRQDEMRQEEEEWKKRTQVIIDRENAADFENAALSHTVFVTVRYKRFVLPLTEYSQN